MIKASMLTMSFICEQKEKSLRNLRTFIIIYRPPDKSVQLKNYFSYFSTKTYVVGTQKNRLNETVLLSTQNICLN